MARHPRDDEPEAAPAPPPAAKKQADKLIALVPLTTADGPVRPGTVVELSVEDAKIALAHHMAIAVPAAD